MALWVFIVLEAGPLNQVQGLLVRDGERVLGQAVVACAI